MCHEPKVIDKKEYGGASQKRAYRTCLKGRVPYTRLARCKGPPTSPVTPRFKTLSPFNLKGKKCIISGPWTPVFRLCIWCWNTIAQGIRRMSPYTRCGFCFAFTGISPASGANPRLFYSIMRFTKIDKVFAKFPVCSLLHMRWLIFRFAGQNLCT